MGHKKDKIDSSYVGSVISNIKQLSQEDEIALISYLADDLKSRAAEQHSTSGFSEAAAMPETVITIPVGIFANDTLSSLEAIVKYLKENKNLKFSVIADLLSRSNKTIWSTYHNAANKMPAEFGNVSSNIQIPVSAISDRSFSALESVVGFIKKTGCSNHEVALMLHLDDRTIWTVYDRIKKKRGIKFDTG